MSPRSTRYALRSKSPGRSMDKKNPKRPESHLSMSAKWSSISRLKDVQLAWMLDVVESRHAKLRTRVIAICLNFRTREAPVYQVLLQQGQVVKSLP